jgi:hypothetical protein
MGIILAAIGVLMLAAGTYLILEPWRRSRGRLLTLLAGISGLLISLYLFAIQLDFRAGYRWLLLVAWAAAGIACGFAILRRPLPTSDLGSATGAVQASPARGQGSQLVSRLASLGVTFGLGFSLLQFWYTYQYTPSQSRSFSLTVSTTLTDSGLALGNPQMHSFYVHTTIKNPGSSEIKILQSAYSVAGVRTPGTSGSQGDFAERLRKHQPTWDAVGRYSEESAPELLQLGTFWGEVSAIEPSQEHPADFQVILPESQLQPYSYLRILLRLVVAKDRLHLYDKPRRMTFASCLVSNNIRSDACTVTQWRVEAPGVLWTLIRGEHVVNVTKNVKYVAGGDKNGPVSDHAEDVWFGPWCVDETGRPVTRETICQPRAEDPGLPGLSSFFGITDITTAFSLVLASKR